MKLLTENVIRKNIKSLVTVIQKNGYQLIYYDIKPNFLTTVTDVVIWFSKYVTMTLWIYDDGICHTYGAPNDLISVCKNWVDDLLTKERQQERVRRYQLELLIAAAEAAGAAATSLASGQLSNSALSRA